MVVKANTVVDPAPIQIGNVGGGVGGWWGSDMHRKGGRERTKKYKKAKESERESLKENRRRQRNHYAVNVSDSPIQTERTKNSDDPSSKHTCCISCSDGSEAV